MWSSSGVARVSKFARLVGAAVFYGRFMPSFSRIGYGLRRLGWNRMQADFSGQTWLITGASSGIGRALAAAAAAAGANVLAVARESAHLHDIAAGLPDEVAARITAVPVDLASIDEVRALVADLAARQTPIDVLVNNAGVLLHEHSLARSGHERSFVINLLSHFVLTQGLLQDAAMSADAVVINVSSGGMYTVPLSIEGLDQRDAQRFSGTLAYARHKRAQVALTEHWQQQMAAAARAASAPGQVGSPARRCYVMHPGWVSTPGVKRSLPVFWKLQRAWLRTPAQGADTILWLCQARPEPIAQRIWFDRRPRPVHLFSVTRQSDCSESALVDWLREQGAV